MIKCSSCNQVVSEGFCLNGGDSYFCSKKCRRTEITDKEWNNLYEDGGDSYWSTFNERHQVVTVEGIEVNTFNTFDEASEAIEKYENADKLNGFYKPDFYLIEEVE